MIKKNKKGCCFQDVSVDEKCELVKYRRELQNLVQQCEENLFKEIRNSFTWNSAKDILHLNFFFSQLKAFPQS